MPGKRCSLVQLLTMFALAVVWISQTTPAYAEESKESAKQTTPFESHIYKDENGSELPYRLLVPKNVQGPMPLLLFLHGAGERGNDNEKQLVWGKDILLKAANEYHCIVIVPQCPEGGWWSNIDRAEGKMTLNPEPAEPMKNAQAVVDQMIEKYDVDSDRLYIMGLSMGGFGSWDAISRWPGRFAAAVPICGGGDTSKAESIVDTPIWAFHGDADPVVSVDLTRAMIKAIKEAGGEPKYTEYPGVGHNSWSPAFEEPGLLDWITSQSLAKEKQE